MIDQQGKRTHTDGRPSGQVGTSTRDKPAGAVKLPQTYAGSQKTIDGLSGPFLTVTTPVDDTRQAGGAATAQYQQTARHPKREGIDLTWHIKYISAIGRASEISRIVLGCLTRLTPARTDRIKIIGEAGRGIFGLGHGPARRPRLRA